MRFKIYSRLTLLGRRWYFNARARNGEIILQSEGYRHKDDAVSTVALIRTEAAASPTDIET